VCNNGSCSISCPSNLDNCSGTCTDTAHDPEHCGGCGQACSTNHTTLRACVNDTCYLLGCQTDHQDCNGLASDGCEAALLTSSQHCGACGSVCNLPRKGTCSGGSCICDAGWSDCNGGSDGCEAQLSSNPSHCGACGVTCNLPRKGTCSGGSCICDSGWADCNGGSDGCETNLTSDTSCGACGVTCPTAHSCINGSCQQTGCVPACGTGQTCVSGTCVGTGTLRFTLTWTQAGDVDLWVVTPMGKTIYYGNAGPSSATDMGRLDVDDTSGTGPENIYWDSAYTPPSGTYIVCANTYLDSARSYTLTVDKGGSMSSYSGTSPGGLYNTACTTSSPGFIAAISYP
jgi:hypothetical protein